MTDRMNELEVQIHRVLIQLLPSLRMNRTISEDQFDRLFELLEETGELIRGADVISRRLARCLFHCWHEVNKQLSFIEDTDKKPLVLSRLFHAIVFVLGDPSFDSRSSGHEE